MSVIDEVVAERRRQVEEEGYTPEYDDQHHDCQLACAAACYALASDDMSNSYDLATRRNLIKAAALIVAEIERLDRPKDQQNGR